MNRKGQFAKTMTTIPVMMIIIVLMVLFVLAASWANVSKEKGNQDASISQWVGKDNVLFETIEINGNKNLVAEEMIREFRKPSSSKGYKVFENALIDSIKNLMIKDANFNGRELCVIIGIRGNIDGAKIDSTSLGSEAGLGYGGINLKKDKEGKVESNLKYNSDMTRKLNEVKINVDGKRIGLISYYGKCSSGGENE